MIKILKKFFNSEQENSLTTNKEERDELCTSIINSSSLKTGFYLLLILSTFIVTIGLLKNSVILVIGGMLVAPLLSPILAISLAITIVNIGVFFRSIKIFLISTSVSLSVSYLLGLVINFSIHDMEMIKLMRYADLSTFLIPIAGGAAASFAWAKKELNSSLPGIAITVTLLPPLTVMGLSLAVNDLSLFKDASNIYILNVLGIIIGSLIIFLLMGFHKSAKKIIAQIKEENDNI